MLRDAIQHVEVLESEVTYRGRVWAIIKDTFMLGGQTITRDYLQHMGAVAVVAVDDEDRVLTITQYRHPVGARMVEIPAGLLDDFDEDPAEAAARELLEESGYVANSYEVLIDICTTPGSSSETLRIYLAKGLTRQDWDASVLHAEEQEISVEWVALDDALEAILKGHWQSPTCVSGILAYAASTGRSLRKPDAEWPLRRHTVETNRVFKLS